MSTPRSWALRFISGKYQGGEFPLKPDREIVIGRSSELDMVLVEDMVSRKHAKIAVHNGAITISDLGSTNGTFVNGEKVKQARLKEGDRILIGTSILKLVSADSNVRPLDEPEARRKMKDADGRRNNSGAMSGRIEEVPLPDLLQLFQTSKKNGILGVHTAEHEGRIYLRGGRVYYAVIDDRHEMGPQKSFYRMITWEKGAFELSPPDGQDFLVELEESTEALLMDGLRQLDELRRIQGDLPRREARIEVLRPLEPSLRDLEPALLEVLQLVWNEGTVGGVMDRSDESDLDTALALVQLFKRGYVTQV